MTDEHVVDFQEDTDLGLDISLSGTNLFEQFHKDQKAGNQTNLTNPGSGDGGANKGTDDDDPAKGGGAGGEKGKGEGEDGKEKIEFKTDNILDMVKDHFKNPDKDKGGGTGGGKGDDDDPDKNKGTGGADKGAGAAAAGEDEEKNIDPATLGVFKTMYEHFTENHGYRPMKEGEFDGTPEAFDKWLEEEKEELAFSAAEQLIEDTFVKSPNPKNAGVALDLFRFIQNGGIVADFVETRKYDTLTAEYISSGADDDEKIERSKTVMNHYYTSQGWDKARIEKTIKNLETGGALLSMAEETLPEFIKFKEKQKAIVEANNISEKQANETKVKEYNGKLLSLIDTVQAVGPFEFKSKKEREALKQYLFVPTVDAGNGKMIPKFLADRQKASSNPLYTLFQALTYMNKGIDLSKVEENAANKTTKTLKEKLEGAVKNNTIDRTTGSSGSQNNNNQRPNISEILDFDNLQTVM